MATGYVPLWCKSNFSFLEGASHPEELIETASSLGIEAMALTDRDGVYGAVEAHVKAREVGIKLIHGAEVSVEDGSRTLKDAINEAMRDWVSSMDTTHYVLGTACGPHPFPTM